EVRREGADAVVDGERDVEVDRVLGNDLGRLRNGQARHRVDVRPHEVVLGRIDQRRGERLAAQGRARVLRRLVRGGHDLPANDLDRVDPEGARRGGRWARRGT